MTPTQQSYLNRKLLFVCGKGGVGKTSVSRAIAKSHAQQGKKTLWISIEDPLMPKEGIVEVEPNYFELNCVVSQAFEEYVGMKIKWGGLAKLFLRNAAIQYLVKIAPGMNEIVLIGKIWYETRNFDHIVVDMPATGHGLVMFNATQNYAKLFEGSPVQKDAQKIMETLSKPSETGFVIVSLPEEMPLAESLELQAELNKLFSKNDALFIINKKYPQLDSAFDAEPTHWSSPLPENTSEFLQKKSLLELKNLSTFSEQTSPYLSLPILFPNEINQSVAHSLSLILSSAQGAN